jgi:uncharacterized protein (DUF2236 family)
VEHEATEARPVLGDLEPEVPTPLGRTSLVRRVAAEPVTALLVQRALVMEVAHPMVGAGVDHHSGFQTHPLKRAWVTADAAVRLLFGDDHVARGAARQIYRVHDHINGALGDPAGPWPRGTPYTAHDASLLTWVWATLVDTAETAYTRWVRPFSDGEARAFYDDMRALARFLGIPAPFLPEDRPAFARYLGDCLEDDRLGSGAVSQDLARQILWYRHWSVPPPAVRLERVLAFATLDRRLVDRLDLRPDARDLALGDRLDAWLAAAYRRVPRLGTSVPHLYVLLRRPTIGASRRIPSRRAAG